MIEENKDTPGDRIIAQAIEFGACLAGIANVEELKKSPSNTISGKQVKYCRICEMACPVGK